MDWAALVKATRLNYFPAEYEGWRRKFRPSSANQTLDEVSAVPSPSSLNQSPADGKLSLTIDHIPVTTSEGRLRISFEHCNVGL
jgi:hypothetical protein